jgi:hypothetical protein
MTLVNYGAMNLNELRQHVLTHREGTIAPTIEQSMDQKVWK